MVRQPETAGEFRSLEILSIRPPRRWVTDILLALLIIGFSVAPMPGEGVLRPEPLTLVFVGLAIALLPLRRRFPATTLVLSVAFFTVVALDGIMSAGSTMAVAIMVFNYNNRLPRRRGMIVALAIITLILALSIPSILADDFSPRVVQFMLTVGIAAAAGDATRSRREIIAAMTERARRAEETREAEAKRRVSEERLRIARDLHDVVAHQIAVISLNAGVATSSVDTAPDKAKASLTTIREASRLVLSEIGDLMAMLRSDNDGSVSAATSPQYGLEQLDSLITQFAASGLDVTVRREGDLTSAIAAASNATDNGLSTQASSVTYRVIQEALTNAHKHGSDHRAHLLVAVDDHELRIVVTNPFAAGDPGPNPTASPTPRGAGLGLIGVRERVASVRGQVEAGPVPGGWRVAASIPLSKETLK